MEVPGKRTDSDDEVENVKQLGRFCEPCQSDYVNTQANGFCKECEDYMCDACFRQHLRAKSCRNHTLLDTYPSSGSCIRTYARATKCKLHDGETVKYYCRTHEAVGCGDCMISNHMTCKPEFIKDLSDNYPENEEYKILMRKNEKLISERKEFEKKTQENKMDNKWMLEKALEDINLFRLDINKYLDKVEKDITSQVENVMKENETLLTKLENDSTVLSTKLEEITNMLNSELYNNDILFIQTVECKPKVSECEKAISDIKSKSIKKYEFVCDKQLRSLVSSAQKLGTLTISSLELSHRTADQANEKSNTQVYAEDNAEGTLERGYKTEEAGVRSVVAVGARVKHNSYNMDESGVIRVRIFNDGISCKLLFGKRCKGTVTDVHDDGSITVKWDRGWSGQYRIGVGDDEVTLIQS